MDMVVFCYLTSFKGKSVISPASSSPKRNVQIVAFIFLIIQLSSCGFRGGATVPPPPQKKRNDRLCFYPILYQNALKNKAHIARESIKKPESFQGLYKRTVRDCEFSIRDVLARTHINFCPPPPPPPPPPTPMIIQLSYLWDKDHYDLERDRL